MQKESPERNNGDGCEIENINNKVESMDNIVIIAQSQLSEDSKLLLAVKELNELRYNGFDKSRNSSISSLSCDNLNNLNNNHKSGNTYESRRTNNNFAHRGPTTTGKAKLSRPSYEIHRNPKTNTLIVIGIKCANTLLVTMIDSFSFAFGCLYGFSLCYFAYIKKKKWFVAFA